jgi:hypothetical protein
MLNFDFMEGEKELDNRYKGHSCDNCGRYPAEYRENPYTHEMTGESRMEWLCDDCYHDLLQSV